MFYEKVMTQDLRVMSANQNDAEEVLRQGCHLYSLCREQTRALRTSTGWYATVQARHTQSFLSGQKGSILKFRMLRDFQPPSRRQPPAALWTDDDAK
jgi:hypothetical protein